MVSGKVFLAYNYECPFMGTIEFYKDSAFTVPIIPPVVLGGGGSYNLPDSSEYYKTDVYIVIRTSGQKILYTNKFYFYNKITGEIQDYTDLNFIIRDLESVCCPDGYPPIPPPTYEDCPQVDTLCSFYIIKKPCSNQICVYNTQNTLYHNIIYTFGKEDVIGAENTCYIFRNYGLHKVVQSLYVSTPGAPIIECCHNIVEGSNLELVSSCEQLINIHEYLPSVNFGMDEYPCCKENNCVVAGTEITFTPFIHLNEELDCCTEDTETEPCNSLPEFTIIPMFPELVSEANKYGQKPDIIGDPCVINGPNFDPTKERFVFSNCLQIAVQNDCCIQDTLVIITQDPDSNYKFLSAIEDNSNRELSFDFPNEFETTNYKIYKFCYSYCSEKNIELIGDMNFFISVCDEIYVASITPKHEITQSIYCSNEPGAITAYFPSIKALVEDPDNLYPGGITITLNSYVPMNTIHVFNGIIDMSGVNTLAMYLQRVVDAVNSPTNPDNNPKKFTVIAENETIKIQFEESVLNNPCDIYAANFIIDGSISYTGVVGFLDCCAASLLDIDCNTEYKSTQLPITVENNYLRPYEELDVKINIVTYTNNPTYFNTYGSKLNPNVLYSFNIHVTGNMDINTIAGLIADGINDFYHSNANLVENWVYISGLELYSFSIYLENDSVFRNNIGSPLNLDVSKYINSAITLCNRDVHVKLTVGSSTNYFLIHPKIEFTGGTGEIKFS